MSYWNIVVLTNRGKTYFVSDIHLGAPALGDNKEREIRFVGWLDEIKRDAEQIFLLGDIFDFWFEYKKVVPRGFIRTLGKIAEITDSGIPVHFFTGNHDVWVFDYLPRELGVIVHREPYRTEIGGKKFYIAHGDGLDKSDKGYLLLKKLFTNRGLQWIFSRLHPNFAFWLAHSWSKKSRLSKGGGDQFKGMEKEGIVKYAREYIQNEHVDIFVTGHRHLPMDLMLNDTTRFINTGDWITHFTYAVFDQKEIELKKISTE